MAVNGIEAGSVRRRPEVGRRHRAAERLVHPLLAPSCRGARRERAAERIGRPDLDGRLEVGRILQCDCLPERLRVRVPIDQVELPAARDRDRGLVDRIECVRTDHRRDRERHDLADRVGHLVNALDGDHAVGQLLAGLRPEVPGSGCGNGTAQRDGLARKDRQRPGTTAIGLALEDGDGFIRSARKDRLGQRPEPILCGARRARADCPLG